MAINMYYVLYLVSLVLISVPSVQEKILVVL